LVNVRPVENRAALEFGGKSIDLDTSLLPVERVLADHFVVIVGELFLERSKPAEEVCLQLLVYNNHSFIGVFGVDGPGPSVTWENDSRCGLCKSVVVSGSLTIPSEVSR
jgi:hypothetical protein